jgi:2-C-methyl-D-erythritol 2,4-cyclodiphosphate synthase
MIRAGIGYDVHRLVKGRRLTLGGVHIPYEYGLEGHSDADVLVHSIMDAILGALGKGDIGVHFPDSDPQYKGANSIVLLKKVFTWAKDEGFRLNNLDSIIVAQKPKLAPYALYPSFTNCYSRSCYAIPFAPQHYHLIEGTDPRQRFVFKVTR